MAELRKMRARKPLVEDGKLTMVASHEGAKGYTLWTGGDIDYALSMSREETLRFVAFVAEMEARRAKAGIA